MAFIESPRFPDHIAYGAQRKRITKTDIVRTSGGYETTDARWSQKLRRYDVGSAIKTESDYQAISLWFDALDGPADAFRLRDHADYQVTTAQGFLRPLHGVQQVGVAGFGYGVPSYQLVKRYSVGSKSHERDIRKPVSGSVSVRRGGASVAPTVDATSGIVTFSADAVSSVVSVTVGATTVVTLSAALATVGIGDRIYFVGLTGADASLLNGLSHSVTNRVGAVYTISTNTLGKSITVGSGAGHAYPQFGESLDWSGQFDVPVRFESDEIDDVIVSRSGNQLLIEAPSIILVEKRV